jgi:non-specific serine/threonine protein kinase
VHLSEADFAADWMAGTRASIDHVIDDALEMPERLVSPTTSTSVVSGRLSPAMPESVGSERQAAMLTSRERDIAKYVAQGLRNRQVAEQLVIAERTVETHLEHIYFKLAIHSRAQLIHMLRA